MTTYSDQYEPVVAVYLNADDIRRILDWTPFHHGHPAYSDESARLGLKMASALLSLETAPIVERAIILTTTRRDSSS